MIVTCVCNSLHVLASQLECSCTDSCSCSDKDKVSIEIAAEMRKKQKTGEFAKNRDAVRCIVTGGEHNLV